MYASTLASAIRETDSLHDAIGKFLESYFSAQEVYKIQQEFAKVRVRLVLPLSLAARLASQSQRSRSHIVNLLLDTSHYERR